MTNFDLHEQAQQLADTRSAYSLARELLELQANRPVWRNTGAPNGLRRFIPQKQYDAQTPGVQKWYEPICEAPEGWQLVPSEVVTPALSWPLEVGVSAFSRAEKAGCPLEDCLHDAVQAMLAAAPKPGEL